MTATPRVSIDQWRALVTVVDAGGYAQASEMLHKAQSAVTYAVKKTGIHAGGESFRGGRPEGQTHQNG